MEKVNSFEFKIKKWMLDDDPDFSELVMWFDASTTVPTVSTPVNDETAEPYHVYLCVNEDTQEIVGAFIFHADNFFNDLARAFADKDLTHPDVRLFLEKKLELYAQRHRDELVSQQSSISIYKTPTS